MGLMSRRPILPAPTDSLLESADDDVEPGTDFGTDLSRHTEKTYETIPDDGSPITITPAPKRQNLGKLSKNGKQSQTSLLIEYFEGGKGSDAGQRRPSLRVRYTPSQSRKNKEKGEGHILVTEPTSARRPSQSYHISLGGNDTLVTNAIDSSISSLPSTDLPRSSAPVEIEVVRQDDSDLSASPLLPEPKDFLPESEISSMPAESSLDPRQPIIMAPSAPSEPLDVGLAAEGATLMPPVIPTERNLSNERITQKVIEKLSNKPRVSSGGKRHHRSHSGSRSSVSREMAVANPESRTRVIKNVEDDSLPSATASSLLSASHLSADPRATDQRSVRSGNSNVSISNNPKLLQTVEDVIRRLILPELNEIRRDQKHSQRSKYDKYTHSDISSSTVSREEVTRRKSSGSKSRHRSSREYEPRIPSGSSQRHRRHKTVDYDSPSEQSYEQSESLESNSLRGEKKSRKHSKSHRARDVAAGALGGAALTAAALKSHDSGSSLEYSEHRRRRRSKSRSSRSASYAEKDDAFQKHQIPPMPFVSEIGTDLTRSSLKSSNDGRSETPTRREVRDVIRGSPLELSSPTSITPTRHSIDLKRGLGTHHGNFSEQDLSGHDLTLRKDTLEDNNEVEPADADELDFATHGFAALTDPERARAYERNLHQQHPIRRGLSPIQSVASYATTEPNRNSLMQPRSSESMNSLKKQNHMDDQVSVSSLSSPTSTDVARSRRPHGISLENRSEIMAQHAGASETTPRQMDPEAVFEEQHLENETYRHSPYLDKVTAGQQVVARGIGAIAEFVEPPSGVESAVASLCDPSLVDVDPTRSARGSQADSLGARQVGSPLSQQDYGSRHSGSPLKGRISNFDDPVHILPAGAVPVMSPIQSPARSAGAFDEPSLKAVHANQVAQGDGDRGQLEHSPESDITTNPSIIRGPIGGLVQGNTDHWPYEPTPPRSQASFIASPASREIGSAVADLVPEALSINRDHDLDAKRDLDANPEPALTPLGVKDEGYETGANPRSPGLYSQGARNDNFTPDIPLDEAAVAEDPFTTKRDHYVSGLSHGMSPMYDSAMGHGRDHIQSKDIVALMDHLTVRDAQRNARDTEILVTLVRSAAEMRNSFEDMKKFIAEQDEIIMDTADRQHERTQKVVGGPRPQPPPTPRVAKSAASEEDMPSKRRNVFQRALRGLGTKNSQEIQNIEAMLIRLLGEVEGLRALQSTAPAREQPRSTSLTSADNARAPTDTGYEPEGQAGTSSTGDRSGFFSNNSSRQADYRNYGMHRDSGNRVSTVMEGDEEYDDYCGHLGEGISGNAQATSHAPFGTPPRNDANRHIRGGSAPLNTPPRMHDQNQGSLSNENTPHLSVDGSGRKHKSFASSIIPKMVSRWSKTTASSADNFRASQQRVRPISEMSRSGSHLGEYDYEHDPHGDDRIRSHASFHDDQYQDHEDRPPSPLIPSQISDNPKYQAHRNSVNLQHPQPRQGPSGRFQSRLESEAQNYNDQMSPTSQTSSQWEQQPHLHPPNTTGTTYGGNLSPTSDAPYSAEQSIHNDGRSVRSGSSHGPPRPPKVPNDDPLIPQRPPKIMMSPPPENRQPTYVDHVAAARNGSPALEKSPVSALKSPQNQARKPSGPRPLTTTGGSKGDLNAVKKTRFRGSPYQVDSDDDAYAAY